MTPLRSPGRALPLAALLLLFPPAPAGALHFDVDDPLDLVDASPGDGQCATAANTCSLRAAIQETNALAGADSIALPAGLFALGIPGAVEDAGATGDLDIHGELTLTGVGADHTVVDGARLDRVFHVAAGAWVEISDVAIQNGQRPEDEQGGGVLNDGDLLLESCHVRDNEAWLSGGIANFGTLHLLRSTVSGNESMTLGNVLGGGGIGNAGVLLVEESTIRDNATLGTGGGIGSVDRAEVIGSTIAGNHAVGNGGGIVFAAGSLTVANTTISGNTTNGHGGGLSIVVDTLTLDNVTLTGNVADIDGDGTGDGGGLRNGGGVAVLGNTILAANGDGGGEAPDCAGNLVSAGHNLIEDLAGCSVGGDPTGNVTGASAGLGPLADNDGPTATHALLPGSPAIDAGSPAPPALCENTDQRLAPRVDGDGDGTATCDMGAYEYLPEPSGPALQLAGALGVMALARARRREPRGGCPGLGARPARVPLA